MRQDVFVLGATGSVGTELVRQIVQLDGDGKGHANPTQLIGFANSNGFVINRGMISEQAEFERISQEDAGDIKKVRDRLKARMKEIIDQRGEHVTLERILASLTKLGYSGSIGHPGGVMIVDATALNGEDIKNFHLQALEGGYKIVTANKNPAAFCTEKEFGLLTRAHGNYDYDTTVMAGSGAVNWIKDRVNVSSPILEIAGCFSGTLSYICSELEKGEKPFSQIVKEARQEGYTEPHPKDDLSGLDVMRKLIILLRTAGVFVQQDDISLEGFIPDKYLQIPNPDVFLDGLKELDEEMARRFADAKSRGNTLRYVAKYKKEEGRTGEGYIGLQAKPSITIRLEEVPKNSSLGSLKGTKNAVNIHSPNHMGDNCFELSAPGAGVERTAESLRAGLADMIPDGHLRFVKE